ncbi:MAG: hypothetical protein ACON5M_01105 [Chitinophagales bacterium]
MTREEIYQELVDEYVDGKNYCIKGYANAILDEIEEHLELGYNLSSEDLSGVFINVIENLFQSDALREVIIREVKNYKMPNPYGFDGSYGLIGVPLKLKNTIVRTDRETGEKTIIKVNDSERDDPSELEA